MIDFVVDFIADIAELLAELWINHLSKKRKYPKKQTERSKLIHPKQQADNKQGKH